ncbi:MAG: ABC transporter ATP-binding protein/permease, partial [Bryobacteraceae bacterium]
LRKIFRKRRGFFRPAFKQELALNDVSFAVHPGETYGLLGPNGSGKSTLIRVLSTLLVPDGGQVRLLGLRLPEDERQIRRKIGRVSVDAAFYKKLSARENLLYTAFVYGLRREAAEKRAMEILENIGLESRRFSDPLEEMSRGMQQKVTIARALLLNPPLLLLDEPTTGLDPKSKRDVQVFLEKLREREGTTILLTTHDMAEAERLCARIGFLAHGKLVAEGTAEELRRHAGTETLDDRLHSAVGRKARRRRKIPCRGLDMERRFLQIWGFVYRDAQLTRRYMSWVVVFTFYAVVNSATIALIGVAAKDEQLTLTLVLGAMLWSFLSVLFSEIANSIAYERWEGTLEFTFMAPVSRLIHLMGVSLFAMVYSIARAVIVLFGLLLFVDIALWKANLAGMLIVLLVSSVAFIGLGLIAAVLPVMSPERGAEATNIMQGGILLVSGVYYPVEVLPAWLQPVAALSPATYALSASRKLMGIGRESGSSLGEVAPELLVLTAMGFAMVPLGLWVFRRAELWAKRNGKLKRTG